MSVLLGNLEMTQGTVLGKTVEKDAHEQVEVQEGDKPEARATAPEAGQEVGYEPPLLMQSLLCAAALLEGVDTQLLGVCMFALQRDIGFVITDIAILTVAQGVCINIAAPFWGILADRGILRRRTILVIGALGQGIVTMSLAFVTELWPMILLRAIVGCLLAALRPISNGIIADCTSEDRRGKLFGRVQFSLLIGMFLSTLADGNMARKTIFGLNGWRVAFVLVGVLAVIVGGLIAFFLQEPMREPKEQKKGIFGTIPYTTMGNMLLYFQMAGIDDVQATVLTALQPVAGAVGNLLGGNIADALARRFGHHGRPLSAQISVAIGIPAMWLIFGGVPAGKGGFGIYFALICAFGLLGSWAQSGTNFPILSEIVPADSRSRVMAWECALENSFANLLGPPVVTNLAITFGYVFGQGAADGKDLDSAAALGKAMQAIVCLPWIITVLAYTFLHWSYPRDVKRLGLQSQRGCEKSSVGQEKENSM